MLHVMCCARWQVRLGLLPMIATRFKFITQVSWPTGWSLRCAALRQVAGAFALFVCSAFLQSLHTLQRIRVQVSFTSASHAMTCYGMFHVPANQLCLAKPKS